MVGFARPDDGMNGICCQPASVPNARAGLWEKLHQPDSSARDAEPRTIAASEYIEFIPTAGACLAVVEVRPNWTLTPPWRNNYAPIN
jgi:hypothetical protein